ncbi:MAG: DUF4810 domain-containing protein [Verrucomicrobia bacterium]|nr:DUF4810 domain-containing protein [Verrucomicrobiota bacterium]
MKKLGGLLCLGALVLFTGCATPTIYSWGRYEGLVYTMYAAPDKATAEMQVIKMEEDFQKARAKNKPVHPGFHAHLGYLYFQLGKADEARRAFETEKANFPESAVLMDRMLASLQKP